MGRLSGFVLGCALLAVPGSAPATSCFVLREVGKTDVVRKGGAECAKRTMPASTFKIPHAMIALETGVIDERQTIAVAPSQDFPSWGGEHTLRTATHDSVFPFFQVLARRIGPEREKEWLRKLDYGNQDASGAVDQFWVNGTLRISPDEQVAFLEKLVAGKLPVSPRSVEYVRSAVTHPPGTYYATGQNHRIDDWPAGATLWAKSGFSSGRDRVSWYVGGVQRGARQWVFAARVAGAKEMGDGATLAIRELTASLPVQSR